MNEGRKNTKSCVLFTWKELLLSCGTYGGRYKYYDVATNKKHFYVSLRSLFDNFGLGKAREEVRLNLK